MCLVTGGGKAYFSLRLPPTTYLFLSLTRTTSFTASSGPCGMQLCSRKGKDWQSGLGCRDLRKVCDPVLSSFSSPQRSRLLQLGYGEVFPFQVSIVSEVRLKRGHGMWLLTPAYLERMGATWSNPISDVWNVLWDVYNHRHKDTRGKQEKKK